MLKTFAAAACFLLCYTVAAHAAELKVAVFDSQVVAEKSNVLKDAKAAMDKTFGPEQKKLEQQRAALEKQSTAMTSGDPAKIAEMQKAQRDYSDKAGAYLRKIQAAENDVRQQVVATMNKAAADYAKKNGYNLILDSQSVAYADGAMDVTNDMVTEVNRVWREAKK